MSERKHVVQERGKEFGLPYRIVDYFGERGKETGFFHGIVDCSDIVKILRENFYPDLKDHIVGQFNNTIFLPYFSIKHGGEDPSSFRVGVVMEKRAGDNVNCIYGKIIYESINDKYFPWVLMGSLAHELSHVDCGHTKHGGYRALVKTRGGLKNINLEKAIERQADIRTIRRGLGPQLLESVRDMEKYRNLNRSKTGHGYNSRMLKKIMKMNPNKLAKLDACLGNYIDGVRSLE